MGNAYIITSGDYSDYHIVAVFTDKQKAEHFLSVYNRTHSSYNQAEMETYKIGDECIGENSELLVELNLLPYGDVIITFTPGEDGALRVSEDTIIQRVFPAQHRLAGQKYDVFQFMLNIGGDEWGTNDEKIKKIAYDRLAEYRARQAGI